jgi:hypothetical protein
VPKQGEIAMRPAWPEDTVFRRLVLDVARRLLRALRHQVKAVVAAEGIGPQIAPVIDHEPLAAIIKLNVLGNVWQQKKVNGTSVCASDA